MVGQNADKNFMSYTTIIPESKFLAKFSLGERSKMINKLIKGEKIEGFYSIKEISERKIMGCGTKGKKPPKK